MEQRREEMIHEHEHLIVVHLNSAGFDAEDIEGLRPDFEAPSGNDRPVRYELQWAPSAQGPCSFEISIIIGAAIGAVSVGFLNALGEDIYKWVKTKLKKVFCRKGAGEGNTIIKFDDVVVHIDYQPSEECYLLVWKALPELLSQAENHASDIWTVSTDERGKVFLKPQDNKD